MAINEVSLPFVSGVWSRLEVFLWYSASLLTSITATLNIVIVFQQKREIQEALRRKFILYSFAIAFWSANVFLFSIIKNEKLSYLSAQLLHSGAILIPVFLLDFVLVFFKLNSKYFKFELFAGYFLAAMFIFLDIFVPSSLISGVTPTRHFANMMSPGPLYPIWMMVFFYYVVSAHIKVFHAYLMAVGNERTKLAFFVFPSFFAYVGCIAYFMPVYGLYLFPYPWTCFGSMIFSPILAYGIIRHNLLGADVIIKRTLVFSGLFVFVYSTFTIVTVLGQEFFRNTLGWNQWTSMIPTVLIITFSLKPLENLLTGLTEKFLFQKKFDYRQLLKTFTTEVLTVLDLQELLYKTVEGLDQIIKLESCSILMLDDAEGSYRIHASTGHVDKGVALERSCGLIYYLNGSNGYLHKESESLKTSVETTLSVHEQFRRLNAELCLSVVFNDKLIGVVTLGRKKSGEDYTQEDIDVLTALASTEAIAISNARLFQELSITQAEAAQKEKMAVVGTLAAGINHEICNPLGIARGQCEMFLLNFRDGIYKDISEKELVEKCVVIFDKVINEVDRATGITKRLSSFAKPSKKFEIGEVKVAHSVSEVLAILGYELRLDNIQVTSNIPADIPALLCDKKQIEEIIFNIVRNAAQAITGKGSISISAHEQANRIVIDIEDTGSGIPADKLNQIFNPFYTTKAPGKGTGLGLFIVKQIVERNRGTIAVKSEIGVGTKFTLSFEAAKQAVPA